MIGLYFLGAVAAYFILRSTKKELSSEQLQQHLKGKLNHNINYAHYNGINTYRKCGQLPTAVT